MQMRVDSLIKMPVELSVACAKSQRPRVFFTFCCLFSLITVLISSLFFYYPDGFRTTPSPSVSFISDGGFYNEKYVRYGSDNNHRSNQRQQYVMGPRPVRGRFAGPGRVEEVGRHHQPPSNGHQSFQAHHASPEDDLLDYIDGHQQDHHGDDPAMQSSNNNVVKNNDSEEGDDSAGSGRDLERIRHQSHHPYERHHLSLADLEQRSNFTQVIDSRLIHLDLKGAPPKMSYIKDVSLSTFLYFHKQNLNFLKT